MTLGVILKYFANTCEPEILISLLVMIIIAILAIIIGSAVKKADPKKPPKGLVFLGETIVNLADKQITDTLGTAYLPFGPYLVFLYLYVPLAFIAGLLGVASPMTYFVIPLCLAFVSWLGIQISAIKFQKIDYIKGFTSPLPTWLPVFVPINILSKLSPLMSLSIRMFGNALAGYILMWLVYWGTGAASSAFLNLLNLSSIGGLNFIGVVVAPWLHAYFDIFGAFVQTLIFTTLTMLLIATEIPAPVDADPSKLNKKRKNKKSLVSQKA